MAPTAPAVQAPTPDPLAALAPSPCAGNTRLSDQQSKIPATGAAATAGPAEEAEATVRATRSVSYDTASNTIVVGPGSPMTLPALSRALGKPEALREQAPGEWLLAANLRIERGALLQVAGPDVQRLKLRSDAQGFVWIKALGGQLEFIDTCVTSWDEQRGQVDEQPDDGRSFVLARDGAWMTIRHSELSYLGYEANESYGVAWRTPGTSGQAIDSYFGHNFYGLYSYEASDLVIRGNEVHHSARYGIDPHTRSNRLTIEGNIAHHNGKQGIILAEECNDSVVRGNTVYNNDLHGIVIYQRSNGNLVEGNTSYGNGLQGINVNDASSATIRNNTVYGNGDAGIGLGQDANNNQLVGNLVRDNLKDGIYLYSGATGNQLRDNTVSGNARYGVYIKSAGNQLDQGNQITGNAVGVYLNASPTPQISRDANRIEGNRDADIRTGN
jgi:parallel beta-helix repeat protein